MSDINATELKPLFKVAAKRYRSRCTLEIGANSGEDTGFLMSFDRFSDIHCFECEPRAIAKWKKNVRNKRAKLHEVALSNQSGQATFHPSGGNPGGAAARHGDWDMSGSLLPFDRHQENAPWMQLREPYTVQTVTLDEWAAANLPPNMVIQFAWVDVQGAEAMVLEGAQETLKRICYWYCECDPRPNYHRQATFDNLNEMLATAGFTYVSSYPGYNHLWRNDRLLSPPANTAPPQPQSVSVDFIGQFGNQLFQYVVAKIAAELTGLPFTPGPGFLVKPSRPVPCGTGPFPSDMRLVEWNGEPLLQMTPTEGRESGGGEFVDISTMQWIDWNQLRDKAISGLSLRGYFQRYECIQPWKDKIKNEWLRFHRPFVDTDDEAVHVHCRLTDYVRGVENPNDPSRHGISLTIDEYAAALEHFPDAKRIVVYTDAPQDTWLKRFDKLGLPWSIATGTWDSDFLAMASCRWLIITQSTFSWWAGFLGRAERIVCPLSRGTLWHFGKDLIGPPKRRDFPNLIVTDEPDRWIWMKLK